MNRSGFFVISILAVLAFPLSPAWPVWFDAGNGICVEAFSQYDPAIASDGAGGAIIVWSDQRAGIVDKDIYAQRISSDGELLWGASGIAVCISSGTQESPVVCPDGQGGAIVYWMDGRAEMSPFVQIYAQRLGPAGSALWTAGGLLVSGMVWEGYVPGFAVDDEGNTYLAWLEEGPDVYREARAQKISPAGSLLWGSTGTSACDSLYNPDDCTISPVAGGGALVAWSKYHSGPEFPGSIFAQRFDASGAALWGTNGIYVFEEPGKDLDLFSAPGRGGSVWLVWRSYEILTGDT
ncbi:MAG TPA: hypothetical protein VLA34_10060, partial [Candidatus Krumholzibacterium sp.]|nr:hypothetical protein [Candidatus Krumholzibacterium sp.]